MPRVIFITHADVEIDPNVPVPDWELSNRGRGRHDAFNSSDVVQGITAVYSSGERKARDGADILARHVGVVPVVHETLHENDRSATGYLLPDEFERVADMFFARPDRSVRGWERASDAQRRVVDAVGDIVSRDRTSGDIAIVAHGGVGTLLLGHLKACPIDRTMDQPRTSGGNLYAFDRDTLRLLTGWQSIDADG